MDNIRVLEAADHVDNGVHLPDVGQELVAQSLPLGGALDQPGDVHKLDDGGGHLVGLVHLGQLVQPLVRDGHHAHVGLNGAEGIVGRLCPGVGDGVKEGALAHIGQSYNT